MRIFESLWQNIKRGRFPVVVLALAMGTGCPQQTMAQSYSYLPWALGSSLLYPLRYLGYSAYGNSGSGNPMWYGGSLLQQATRGYGGMGYNGYSPYGNPNFANVNNGSQTYAQGNVLRYGGMPNNNQNSNTNYSNTAPVNSQPGNYSSSNYPVAGAPQYGAGQPYQTPAIGSAYSNTSGFPTPNQAPDLSTSGHKGKQKNKNRKNSAAQAPASTPSQQPLVAATSGVTSVPSTAAAAPFAVAFINNVNTEYNGDIRKALSNSQTRAWAQSLGVTFNGQSNFSISDERSGIIERVLKDNSLDPVSKLDTIKILLRN